jgi:hypothetical protein
MAGIIEISKVAIKDARGKAKFEHENINVCY